MPAANRPNARLAGAALIGALAALAPSPARADIQQLTAYEKTGRAPLVVWGEVTDGVHRFAVIRTLDVIKCSIPERPAESFRIAFRLDSFLRPPWQEAITFKNGEHVLLYLRKFTKEDGRQPDGDLYTLMWGEPGRETLPPEGEEARVTAVRRFAAILSAPTEDQPALLRAALRDPNPLIADGSFEEAIKQGIGDVAMIPELVELLSNARQPPRVYALRMMALVVSDARAAGREVPRRDELSEVLRGRAATDPVEPFRVQAVATLAELGGEDNKVFLQRVAREDASQLVRYEAEKALQGWAVRGRP